MNKVFSCIGYSLGYLPCIFGMLISPASLPVSAMGIAIVSLIIISEIKEEN